MKTNIEQICANLYLWLNLHSFYLFILHTTNAWDENAYFSDIALEYFVITPNTASSAKIFLTGHNQCLTTYSCHLNAFIFLSYCSLKLRCILGGYDVIGQLKVENNCDVEGK